jgi:hypothetical protein
VFNACGALTVDTSFIQRKFYASLNSVLVECSSAEQVKVQLIKSFCQPLLTYCIGALELSVSAVNELAVCWNNAFRKIFHYKCWESVKQLQYFCGCQDFKHMYDLARYKFLMRVVTQLPHLSLFCASRSMFSIGPSCCYVMFMLVIANYRLLMPSINILNIVLLI